MTDNRSEPSGTRAGLTGGRAHPFAGAGSRSTNEDRLNKAARSEQSSSLDGDADLLPDTSEMTTLEAAEALAASGLRIFPCAPAGARPKAPLINDWQNRASADPAFVKTGWSRSPVPAIGLPTGDVQVLGGGAELVVIDLDVKNDADGVSALQQVELELGPLPDTFTVATPSGGLHRYFSVPQGTGLRNSASSLGPGIDVRANGGYVVAPGSELSGKGWYKTTRHLPIAALPPEWIARLGDRSQKQRTPIQTKTVQGSTMPSVRGTPYGQAALREEINALRNAAPGTRNSRLNTSAFSLGQLVASGHLDKEDVLFSLMEACVDNHLINEGFDAVRATIESGLKAGLAAPRDNVPDADTNGRTLTEDALALMFADRHEHQFLYDHTRDSWFFWEGSCWEGDQTGRALMACRDLIRQTAVGKDAVPLNKTAVAKAVLTAAAADPRMRITHEEWNADPWLLGVPGGIVDLKTGELLPPDPAKRINAQTGVAPAEPGISGPLWQKFLHEATNGDTELERFLQQTAGYVLTGDTSEEIFFFIHGPGGNGKGVFIGALGAVMGDYAKAAPMQTFMTSKSDRHLTELARLVDARLVTASETEEGRQLAVARIKELSGNERPIAANFMRQDHFEYVPRFKIVLVGNDKPKIPSVDDGMRRRLRLVPFTHRPEQVDLELKEKLKAEQPAILRWAIEGCLDWKTNGFVKPAIIAEATNEYLLEEDVRAQWLAEHTIKERNAFTASSELFANWEKWASERSEYPGNSNEFGRWLAKQGYTSMKIKGERGFAGLRFKNLEESDHAVSSVDG